MSKTVMIGSSDQFAALLKSSRVVVADCREHLSVMFDTNRHAVYADWCGPCKQIAPIYEQLSAQLSRPKAVTFTKINVDNQKEIAAQYKVSAMPTFMVFKAGKAIETVRGADPKKLNDLVRKIAQEAESDGGSSSGGGFGDESWLGAATPRGYSDATEEVDVRGLDLMNADSELGGVRTLFEPKQPSSLAAAGKGKGKVESGAAKDWIESDTDDQLMLYVPFKSTLKIRELHITSVPVSVEEAGEDDDPPMRPKTIKLFTNRSTNMGFDEADGQAAAQEFTIETKDWDADTATAKLELRFVRFQNVTSLVVFVVDGDGDGEKTRIDRLRIIGEVGEKREMGKLEKVGDDH